MKLPTREIPLRICVKKIQDGLKIQFCCENYCSAIYLYNPFSTQNHGSVRIVTPNENMYLMSDNQPQAINKTGLVWSVKGSELLGQKSISYKILVLFL